MRAPGDRFPVIAPLRKPYRVALPSSVSRLRPHRDTGAGRRAQPRQWSRPMKPCPMATTLNAITAALALR